MDLVWSRFGVFGYSMPSILTIWPKLLTLLMALWNKFFGKQFPITNYYVTIYISIKWWGTSADLNSQGDPDFSGPEDLGTVECARNCSQALGATKSWTWGAMKKRNLEMTGKMGRWMRMICSLSKVGWISWMLCALYHAWFFLKLCYVFHVFLVDGACWFCQVCRVISLRCLTDACLCVCDCAHLYTTWQYTRQRYLTHHAHFLRYKRQL